jgi:hypothetical protein
LAGQKVKIRAPDPKLPILWLIEQQRIKTPRGLWQFPLALQLADRAEVERSLQVLDVDSVCRAQLRHGAQLCQGGAQAHVVVRAVQYPCPAQQHRGVLGTHPSKVGLDEADAALG